MALCQSDLPSGAESRESHLAFIRQNLDIAAAVAWQGYQDKGRCAILIVSRWGDERQPWTAGITPACVLPRKRILRILDDANPLARSAPPSRLAHVPWKLTSPERLLTLNRQGEETRPW